MMRRAHLRSSALALALTLLTGCGGGPADVVTKAIEAVADDDVDGWLATLDEGSRAVADRGLADRRVLPARWHWMDGRPWQLFDGAEIQHVEQVADRAARVRLQGGRGLGGDVWVIKTGGGPRAKWRIRLLGADGLYAWLRTGKR